MLTMKQNLLATLNSIKFVATTTDCWTSRRNTFIGLNERQSAALAGRRLKALHTFDVLAAVINDIHCDYKI